MNDIDRASYAAKCNVQAARIASLEREAHDAEVRRAEWERMYHLAVTEAGEAKARIETLEATLHYTLEYGTALEALVEAVEWVLVDIIDDEYPYYECPWCKERKRNGHAADCNRQRTLARAKGQGQAQDEAQG